MGGLYLKLEVGSWGGRKAAYSRQCTVNSLQRPEKQLVTDNLSLLRFG